jgi:hypothetical protein
MKVQFIKQIHGTFASFSTTDIWLSKTLDLPVIPKIGETVRDGDFEEVVQEIVQDAKDGTVTVIVTEDNELSDYALRNIVPIARAPDDYMLKRIKQIAERYIKEKGWEKYE